MKNIILILLCSIFLSSCLYEDKGNYEYDKLPNFTITGVEKSYGDKILNQDVLEITPIVTFTDNSKDQDYTYCWSRTEGKERVTISEEKNLRYKSNVIGRNMLRLVVTHKATGMYEWVDTECNFTSISATGIYLLKQTKDGNSDVDVFFRDADGAVTNKTEDLLLNHLGGAAEGIPVSLDYNKYRWSNTESSTLEVHDAITVVTQEEIEVIRTIDYKRLASYEDLFMDVMPPKGERKIQGLYSISDLSLLVYQNSEGKNKVRTRTADKHSTFGFEFSGHNVYNKPLPGFNSLLMYDTETCCFVHCLAGTPKFNEIAVKPDGFFGKCVMGNFNSDVVYFGQSDGKAGFLQGNGYGYALLKKRNDPDSMLLGHIALNHLNTQPTLSCMQKIDTISAKQTALSRAEHFSMHQDGGIMYFTIGNSLNIYYPQKKTEELNVAQLPDGEITWFKYIKEINGVRAPLFRYSSLVIATYNQASDSYKVGFYDVESNGTPKPTPHTLLEGKGRVHSIKDVVPMHPARFFVNTMYY